MTVHFKQLLKVLAIDDSCYSADRSSQLNFETFVFSVPSGDARSARMPKEVAAEGW